MCASVFIIDDDETFRDILERRFALNTDFRVLTFAEPAQALAQAQKEVHAIFLDMRLANSSGLDAIQSLRERFQPTHLIMLTGYASIVTSVEAMRRGATDYLAKPVGFAELLNRITGGSGVNSNKNDEAPDLLTPAQVEWEHIQRALMLHNGNITAAANSLGMHRRTLQRKLQKYSPHGRR
ncbi:two-component system response regulator [Aliidiomarina iranensis]|uniref:Two-component system response regulator n=1 Tax=Aliidiomarina iranensis TaxID=1434071 RepID=A0A432W2E3_9GAMM|nr:response regulator [Aliidiomarina iranensis]RUO23276.1 two-component system response regulator [Aliidiomarina iranensis]